MKKFFDAEKLFNKERWLKKEDKKLSWKTSLLYAIGLFSLSILFPLVYLTDASSSTLDILIPIILGNFFFFLGIVFLFFAAIEKIAEEIKK